MAHWRNGNFIGSFTFSDLPSASSVAAGTEARVTDIGAAGSIWMSDGTVWRPENGAVTLGQSATPLILPSSGSIGDNGALTGITALPQTYANCYMYFPVDAIAAGVAAGLYYVQMSSTSAGTIYNNTYTSGNPTIPASPTAFATTGPGAYTQTTGSDIALVSITVPGNSLGLNGALHTVQQMTHANSSDDKIHKVKLSTTAFSNNTYTTSAGLRSTAIIHNRGVANLQAGGSTGTTGGTGTAGSVYGSIDTTNDQSLTITSQLEAAADYSVLEAFSVELRTQ